MITDDSILEQAPLFALGALEGEEKAAFEAELKTSEALRGATAGFCNLASLLPLGFRGAGDPLPSTSLKARILSRINPSARTQAPEESFGVIITGKDGFVLWANQAFTQMCGHTLEELRGRKPGAVLQGELTDPADVEFLRSAIRQRQPCTRSIVNYHKDGSAYRVNIDLTPLRDEQHGFQGYLAVEKMVEQLEAA